MQTGTIWPIGVVVGLLLSVAGCGQRGGPELATVQGTVTFDSQPLAGATVLFSPEQGKSSRSVTDELGHYELTYLRDINGARLGRHQVSITTATEHSPVEHVPVRYNRQTMLTSEVQSGSNEFNFDLNTK